MTFYSVKNTTHTTQQHQWCESITQHSKSWNPARFLPLTFDPCRRGHLASAEAAFRDGASPLFPNTAFTATPTVPAIAHRSHDLTGLRPPGWRGRPAVLRAAERRRAEAEALEGAEQVEAAFLALALGVDDLGELAGQRHLPPDGAQMAGVLGALGQGEGGRQRRQNSFKSLKPPTSV